jgi:hypothetical protein
MRLQQKTTGVNRKRQNVSPNYFARQSDGMARKTETPAQTLQVAGISKNGKRLGRPQRIIPEEDRKKALEACKLGIPLERVAILCGFPSGNAGGWQVFLQRNPSFADQLEKARLEGELELSSVVRQCGNGWQGSAWLLERTRGYVARAQLEHTGKGGKELSVSGALLGAFGGGK